LNGSFDNLHDPQSILSSNRFFCRLQSNHIPHQKVITPCSVVFYPALLCRQFRKSPSFQTRSQLSKFGFLPISNHLHHRGFRKDPFTMNGVGRIASRTKKPALSVLVFRDSTVQCQSNHPKSVHVSSGYRHKRFVESQTNTPPDQLSEAQDLSKYQLRH
jgi:hypothetical protein